MKLCIFFDVFLNHTLVTPSFLSFEKTNETKILCKILTDIKSLGQIKSLFSNFFFFNLLLLPWLKSGQELAPCMHRVGWGWGELILWFWNNSSLFFSQSNLLHSSVFFAASLASTDWPSIPSVRLGFKSWLFQRCCCKFFKGSAESIYCSFGHMRNPLSAQAFHATPQTPKLLFSLRSLKAP